MEATKRTLALTHEQIETVLHALAIAESKYQELYEDARKLAIMSDNAPTLKEEIKPLFRKSFAFGELQGQIKDGQLDFAP